MLWTENVGERKYRYPDLATKLEQGEDDDDDDISLKLELYRDSV